MRVNVAALGSRFQESQIDVTGDWPWHEILVVLLPRYFDATDLDEEWQKFAKDITVPVEAVILRTHPGDEASFIPRNGRMPTGLEILRRRANAPIYLLMWSVDQHDVSLVSVGDLDQLHEKEHRRALIAIMARAELLLYAGDPHAWFPENSSFHYRGPNGQHYNSFLRVASALQTPDRLDAAAFWLLPFVKADTVVLLDSSTISVVGLHLDQYLRDTGIAPNLSIRLVSPMRGYDEEVVEQTPRRVTHAIPVPSERNHVLLLVSVVGTGGLALQGRAFAESLKFAEVTAVGIYGTGDPAAAIERGRLDALLAPIEDSDGRDAAADCPICNRRRGKTPALPITPDNYLIEVSHPITTELGLSPMKAAKEVVGRYAGSIGAAAFTVHRNEPAHGLPRRPRHHGIYIDVSILMDDPAFKERLTNKLRTLQNLFDIILAPEHDAARKLAEAVSDYLGIPALVRNAESLDRLEPSVRELLHGRRLLIVDDAIITGTRLRGYRMSMLANNLIPAGDVHVLAGFLRPENAGKHQGIANLVHQMGTREKTLHAVEEIYLPNLGIDRCPWCWELDLLDNYGGAELDQISQRLLDRASQLDAATAGMSQHLFWGWDDDSFRLGPDSVLGTEDLTQAQIFTIISSALQTLRSDGKLDEDFRPPISKVLDPAFWLDLRFYAEPLTASILRASQPHDIMTPIPGRQFREVVQTRFADTRSRNLRTELLLAVIGGKLPMVPEVASALTEHDVDDGLLGFFNAHLPGLAADLDVDVSPDN